MLFDMFQEDRKGTLEKERLLLQLGNIGITGP